MEIFELKTMQRCEIPADASTVVALGTFDGCHKGHLSVFSSALRLAFSLKAKSVVYTFSSLPMTKAGARCIFSLDEKVKFVKALGFDYICIEDFSEVSNLSGEEFYSSILKGSLHSVACSCGFNFKFGKNGACLAQDLARFYENDGGRVHICEKIEVDCVPISSTLLREFIENGECEKLLNLSQPYSIYARVFEGKHLGRTIGIPTINQYIPRDKVVPKKGVYITECEIGEDVYPAITNVGVRPTTDPEGSPENIETHIIGYDGILYGSFVRVNFYKRLRDEIKFSSIDELKRQIELDIQESVKYFK